MSSLPVHCPLSSTQSRVLQVDGNDRTHSETRLKAELGAADHRVQQLEAESSSLRRRVLDVTEGKGATRCAVLCCVRL